MGQSASLYEINKATFLELEGNPSSFNFRMAVRYESFEENQDGILFVLAKCVAEEFKENIQEIFYPNKSLGGIPDGEPIDFLKLEEDPISYHSIEKVHLINKLLSGISAEKFLSQYDSKELNENQVYPYDVWHDDESPQLGCNKRDLEEGFHAVKNIFKQAAKNENYILSFVG